MSADPKGLSRSADPKGENRGGSWAWSLWGRSADPKGLDRSADSKEKNRDDYDGTSIGSGWRGEYAYMDEYIPGSWICDGDVDCADTSDEASCWDYSGSSSGWLSGSGSGWWSGSGSGSGDYQDWI